MQQALDDLDSYDDPLNSALLREIASRVEAIEKAVKRLEAVEKAIQTIMERTTPKSPCLFALEENRDGHYSSCRSRPRLPNRKSGPTVLMPNVLKEGPCVPL
ncbi:unnamed protein product [Heligmosomoides polygyrus]|uniref:Uncharacterized protein n=1 Tax=Heligmosomoides polygyrus TaxID=6339 RepID=A0A183FL06_HELPZ|nr:unnamed protein product [Heligmosomoides polygyrus]